MSSYEQFRQECSNEVTAQGDDKQLQRASIEWISLANPRKYSYHFEWLGRPIIQYPQDIIALQELIWRVKPDLIVETGIAHGGSLIFSASMLELNAVCGASQASMVVGIDIDIRPHNRAAIESHPMARRIKMIQGSSTAPAVIEQIRALAKERECILVCLDSNHTHEHVLEELKAYAPLVSVGSYCVVFDTVIDDLPSNSFPDRPWGKGNNPKTAVHDWLRENPEFEIDVSIDHKLLITVAPHGFLRRIR